MTARSQSTTELHYLDFDFSDEDSGRGSFDAMASVIVQRLPALRAEVASVLRWAHRAFGPAGALQDEGEWDYDLQAVAEPGNALAVSYEPARGDVVLALPADAARATFTLTLSGSPAFCAAFRQAFASAA